MDDTGGEERDIELKPVDPEQVPAGWSDGGLVTSVEGPGRCFYDSEAGYRVVYQFVQPTPTAEAFASGATDPCDADAISLETRDGSLMIDVGMRAIEEYPAKDTQTLALEAAYDLMEKVISVDPLDRY